MSYILGLDLGETSVGWAVLEERGNKPVALKDAGVRVFPKGAEVDEKRGISTSESQTRRQKRSQRRIIRRRSDRKKALKNLLLSHALLPSDNEKQESLLQADPYEIRTRGLDTKLRPNEIGRALVHINQRRGFKSNRKSGDLKEEGILATSIGTLAKAMEESQARSFGEYLYRLDSGYDKGASKENTRERQGVALRNRGGGYEHLPSRAMIEDEFHLLWSAQAAHHPGLLTKDLKRAVEGIIFYQRSYAISEDRRASWGKKFVNAKMAPQLKHCPLFPEEYRSPAGTWEAQRFRLLKEVNNLEVLDEYGKGRKLDTAERKTLVDALGIEEKQTFVQLSKLIALPKEHRFNLEAGERKHLDGNKFEVQLIKGYYGKKTKKEKEAWLALDGDFKGHLRELVANVEDADQFTETAKELGLTEKQIEGLRTVQPTGNYLAYSYKAIQNLLQFLEDGLDEYHAIQKAREQGVIPPSNEPDEYDLLPLPPDLPNPIVTRALHETRKVVNLLIKTYGKPSRIVVELAREVKHGPKRRQSISRTIEENRKRNEKVKAWYREHGVLTPTRDDVIKYKLWEDQNHLCVYTGKTIDQEDLLSDQNVVDIDHILPRSRSFDDSYRNKVLCVTQANREKGQRLPVEWLGGPGNERFDKMLVRLKNMPSIGHDKFARFNQEKIDTEHAIARQLVDTQYISREAVAYLNQLFPKELRVGEKAVGTVIGKLTSDLRHVWGLNTILSGQEDLKNREDHRHHALDAIVVACATRKHVQELAKRSKWGQDPSEVPPPWKRFRDDVKHMVDSRKRTWKLGDQEITTEGMLVSHRAEKKILGGFHQETNYGPTRDPEWFVRRVGVRSLTGPMIKGIRDDAIRRILTKHCEENGYNPEQDGRTIPPKVFQTLPTMPSGVPIRSVRIVERKQKGIEVFGGKNGIAPRAVLLGNNHHLEMVERDNNGVKEMLVCIVPTLEAARRSRIRKEPIVQRDHGEGMTFKLSLARKEAVVFHKNGKHHLCYISKMSGSSTLSKGSGSMDLTFRLDKDARPAGEGNKSPFARIVSFKAWDEHSPIKVAVDPIGRLSKAND